MISVGLDPKHRDSMLEEYGSLIEVVGKISPWTFVTDQGEQLAGFRIEVPGGDVGVQVDPEMGDRFKTGQKWYVVGVPAARKPKGEGGAARLAIKQVLHARLMAHATSMSATFDFGDNKQGAKA